MRKNIFLGIVLSLLLNCSTSIKVQVLKPSVINLGPIKKIAVLDFHFSGDWDFTLSEKEDTSSLGEVLIKAIATHIGLLPPPPPPPDPHTAFPGSEISAMFTKELVNNGHYTVIERQQLQKVIREQRLSVSGALDPTQAVQIGKLAGVEALIIGTGTYSVKDVGMWIEDEKKNAAGKMVADAEGNAVKVLKYKAARKVDVALDYRIVNVATSEIMAVQSHSISNYTETKSKKKYSEFAIDTTKGEAIKKLPPWHPIVTRLSQKLITPAIKQIAPYYVWRKRKIEHGKTPPMKISIKYVKKNMWHEAKEQWESVLQDNSKAGKKDHVAALYNLGIYYEIYGRLDEAEKNFEKCFKMSGKSKYLDAKANIIKRKDEIRRLENQRAQ